MFPALAAAAQPIPPGRARTLDDDLSDLAGEVPGFGGLFFDETGTLTVRLKDAGRMAEAQSRVSAFLSRGEGSNPARLFQISGQVARMRVLPAAHDFRELRNWYLSEVVPNAGTAGVTMTDIDEVRNRIVIGVRDPSLIPAMQARMRTRGLPADAFEVVEFSGARIGPAITVTSGEAECDPEVAIEPCPPPPGTGGGGETSFSVTSLQRPVPGGMQIQFFDGPQPANCTLGYNMRPDAGADPTRYFVTAAHCATEFGQVTQLSMGQPTVNEQIGIEFADLMVFDNSVDPACPPGRQCRYSDAALFKYDNNAVSNQGKVALPPIGSLIAIGLGPVVSQTSLLMGATVQKVGRTTGNTTGIVQATCADFPQFNPDGFDTGRTMLCQYQASYASAGGDSGAPVFQGINGTTSLAAAGLHWGNGIVGGSPISIFSRLSSVLAELGSATGFGVNPF